jgi:hypothetical protein
VAGVLANPVLTVFQGSTRIVQNDDWSAANPVEIDAVGAAVGAFALDNPSKDSAIVVTLAPGVYTAQVAGVGGATGIAMVEVYVVP